MAAKEETPKDVSTENEPPKDACTEDEPQSMIEKVAALPLVHTAYEMVSTTYSSAKESHPAIQAVCDMAETGVKTMATSAVSSAQPLLDKLEPQIAAANSYACKGLDKLQETLQVVEKVVLDTKDLIVDAKDSICSKVTEVKDVMSSMVDEAIETTQENVLIAEFTVASGLSTMIESSLAMVDGGVEKVFEKSEELIDHFLPLTEEELASLAASLQLEGSGIAPIEKQKQQQSYYVQLGSLSTKLRDRAYQYSLGKLRKAKQTSQEMLAQLQEAIDLVKNTKQAMDQTVQEKLQEMLLAWKKSQQEEQVEANKEGQMEIESQALGLTHRIAQKLQGICQSLLTNVQGLPVALQEKVKQAYSNIEDLQVAFSGVQSFQDLSNNLLAQSEEKMTKAREAVDELLEYVAENAPLTWIVGPFSPAGTSTTKLTEPEEGGADGCLK
ncbi:perilipin-3-like isoform X2 [Heteronotia binoei]|nr:perilipin-3-like isoform X2 [Heteronotia binoei]XP_060092986.1 perilipin-3-like isoform X2 [Heteronotia binoei]